MKTFFGFALADGMFVGDCTIARSVLKAEQAKALIAAGVEPCLNPSHEATIHAMRSRYGIDVQIPAQPPRVEVKSGEAVLVMGVRGLPRLTDRHEYTSEEVAKADFQFTLYTVR